MGFNLHSKKTSKTQNVKKQSKINLILNKHIITIEIYLKSFCSHSNITYSDKTSIKET